MDEATHILCHTEGGKKVKKPSIYGAYRAFSLKKRIQKCVIKYEAITTEDYVYMCYGFVDDCSERC